MLSSTRDFEDRVGDVGTICWLRVLAGEVEEKIFRVLESSESEKSQIRSRYVYGRGYKSSCVVCGVTGEFTSRFAIAQRNLEGEILALGGERRGQRVLLRDAAGGEMRSGHAIAQRNPEICSGGIQESRRRA